MNKQVLDVMRVILHWTRGPRDRRIRRIGGSGERSTKERRSGGGGGGGEDGRGERLRENVAAAASVVTIRVYESCVLNGRTRVDPREETVPSHVPRPT